MSAQLAVRCNDKTPEISSAELGQKLAHALASSPRAEISRDDRRFTFDELGIAISLTLDENSNHTTARVRVSDSTRIGDISQVFKTFVTLGWAL